VTPKQKLDAQRSELRERVDLGYQKALKKIQDGCTHPESHRKEDPGSYWHEWPDYGFTPGRIWCDLCGATLGKSYKGYGG